MITLLEAKEQVTTAPLVAPMWTDLIEAVDVGLWTELVGAGNWVDRKFRIQNRIFIQPYRTRKHLGVIVRTTVTEFGNPSNIESYLSTYGGQVSVVAADKMRFPRPMIIANTQHRLVVPDVG